MNALAQSIYSKKPLHFREGQKCQNRQKWSYKGLNWVSRTVLYPDNDDIGIFGKFVLESKKAHFVRKCLILSILIIL